MSLLQIMTAPLNWCLSLSGAWSSYMPGWKAVDSDTIRTNQAELGQMLWISGTGWSGKCFKLNPFWSRPTWNSRGGKVKNPTLGTSSTAKPLTLLFCFREADERCYLFTQLQTQDLPSACPVLAKRLPSSRMLCSLTCTASSSFSWTSRFTGRARALIRRGQDYLSSD